MFSLPDAEDARLRIYAAIGTPVDHEGGVDAFLEFDERDPKTARMQTKRVTFDLTLRPEEKSSGRAYHVVIGRLPDPDMESHAFVEEVERIAREVAELLGHRSA